MKLLVLAAVVAATTTLATPAYADPLVSAGDRAFLTTAGNGAAFEILGGQIAAQRGRDTRVHAMAIRLVGDHMAGLKQLDELDGQLGLGPENSPSVEQRDILILWSQLPLGPFDCAYAGTEFTDHQASIAAYQAEAAHGDDSRIRAFAAAQLPTLQGHLAMVAASLTDLWCQP